MNDYRDSMLYRNIRRTIGNIIRFAPRNVSFLQTYQVCRQKHQQNVIRRFMFLIQVPSVWNSFESILEAIRETDNAEIVLVALPPVEGATICTERIQEIVDFCHSKSLGKTVCAYENGDYIDLAMYHPDYIFIDEPYSLYRPEKYSLRKLSRIAPVCYVSYGYCLSDGSLVQYELDEDVLRYVSYYFSSNPITYRYFRNRVFVSEWLSHKRAYEIGYPRFDLYPRNSCPSNSLQKTILWLPRWTTSSQAGNEPSTFFQYKDILFDYVSTYPNELSLILRPHPKAFDNYIRSGLMSEKEVEDYKQRFHETPNAHIDQDYDYLPSLQTSDILVADFTSLLAEFFILDRPIIYLGSIDEKYRFHRDMFKSFYVVQNQNELITVISNLLDGVDPLKEQRHKAVEAFRNKHNGTAGKRIVDFLLRELNDGMGKDIG